MSTITLLKGNQSPSRAVVLLLLMITHVNNLAQMNTEAHLHSLETAGYWSNCEMLKVCAFTLWKLNVTFSGKLFKIMTSSRIVKDTSY